MRITEAAQRLGMSPRMLRYRDMLGLLPPVRKAAPAPRQAASGAAASRAAVSGAAASRAAVSGAAASRAAVSGGAVSGGPGSGGAMPGGAVSGAPRAHRQFGDGDLAAVAHALRIERRYDISPAALAFGLRVLTEPGVRAEVAELARRIGRIRPLPARALEFEKERALRLLNLAPGRTPPTRAGESRRSAHRSTRP